MIPKLNTSPAETSLVGDAHKFLMFLHGVKWKDFDDLGPIIEDIITVEKALADQNIVYRLPNADRQTAIKNVENIFSGVSTEDAVSARDFLRRLAETVMKRLKSYRKVLTKRRGKAHSTSKQMR